VQKFEFQIQETLKTSKTGDVLRHYKEQAASSHNENQITVEACSEEKLFRLKDLASGIFKFVLNLPFNI
jgi:hypothetical protein